MFMYAQDGMGTHPIHDNFGEIRWIEHENLGIHGTAIVLYLAYTLGINRKPDPDFSV